MSAKLYNIIWADDEFASLSKDDSLRELFFEKGINILEGVTSSEKLAAIFERYKDRVDAIIIDGNFSRTDKEYLEKDDISGLIHSLSLISLFNVKRDIPFFLCTGRKALLQQICKNGELDYFVKNNRLFQKGDTHELVESIIRDVNQIHSIEWWVHQRYGKLLKKVESIDKQSAEHLEQFLLDEARDVFFEKADDLFNHLRKMFERIEDICHDELIVPLVVKGTNSFKYFWSESGYEQKRPNSSWIERVWKPKRDDILPDILSRPLAQVIDIIQDGSHYKEDSKLNVTDYVFNNERPFLFRFCLHYTLEFFMWFADLLDKLDTDGFETPLYIDEPYIRNNRNRRNN